jgi:hypothetical protein
MSGHFCLLQSDYNLNGYILPLILTQVLATRFPKGFCLFVANGQLVDKRSPTYF